MGQVGLISRLNPPYICHFYDRNPKKLYFVIFVAVCYITTQTIFAQFVLYLYEYSQHFIILNDNNGMN